MHRVARVAMIEPRSPAGLVVAMSDALESSAESAAAEAARLSLPMLIACEAVDPASIADLMQAGLIACIPSFAQGNVMSSLTFLANESCLRYAGALRSEDKHLNNLFLREFWPPPLTASESHVLDLVAAGMTNAGVAQRLAISEGAVRVLMASVLRKLFARNRNDATRVADRLASGRARPVDEVVDAVFADVWGPTHMPREQFVEGSTLVRRSDGTDHVIYLQQGEAELTELGVRLKPRDFFAEFDILGFPQPLAGSHTLVCRTAVEARRLCVGQAAAVGFPDYRRFLWMVYLFAAQLIRGRPGDPPGLTAPH